LAAKIKERDKVPGSAAGVLFYKSDQAQRIPAGVPDQLMGLVFFLNFLVVFVLK